MGARKEQTITPGDDISLPQHRNHPRDWRHNRYVYPVISRRSAGLSIGINLNPDTVCNFHCVYCQVDRSRPARVPDIDLDRLRQELSQTIAAAQSGELFDDPSFSAVPDSRRSIKDIAFSGDGEPTATACFREAVEIAAAVKREAGLAEARIVLMTNACHLTRLGVEAALTVIDENNGEIWAKLDAGTEAYYQKVNRPSFPLRHVLDNIIAAARIRPVVIQSLFMRLEGQPPHDEEMAAYVGRLKEIIQAGGSIKYVQVHTVARPPTEKYVTPLTNDEVDRIARLVREHTALDARAFYSA